MNKSKITQFMKTGTGTWKDKTLTKFSVQMENGDQGVYTTGFNDSDKEPEVGAELEYEIQDKGYGPEIKPKVEPKAGGFGGSKFVPNPKKEALITATAICCKLIDKGMEMGAIKMEFVEWYKMCIELQTEEAADKLPF